MKTTIAATLALAIVSGAAFGIDYTNVRNNARWSLASTWDNGASFPNGANACVYLRKTLNNGVTTESPYNYLVGQIVQDNTSATFTVGPANSSKPNTTTITADDSAGQSGNILFKAGALGVYQMNLTLNADGNIWLLNSFSGSNARTITLNLFGNNKELRWTPQYFSAQNINIYGQNVWDNASVIGTSNWQMNSTLTVRHGGSIGWYPGKTSTWLVHQLVFEDGQSNLPALLSPVDFRYTALRASDNNVDGRLAVAGGVTYPRDVWISHGYWNTANARNPYYTWQIRGGDVTIGRDLLLKNHGNYSGGEFWLSTLENGTSISRNLTVNQDLKVADTTSGGYYNDYYGVRGNASTIRVGRDLIVRDNGTLQMGSATWYLGEHLTLSVNANPAKWVWTRANWSAGTSTLVCDGNGTAAATGRKAQTLTTYGDCGIALNNLYIRNDCATVSLANGRAGILLLTGDLRLEKSLFNDNDRAIIFAAGSHTLFWDNSACRVTGNSLDNVVLRSGASVALDTGSQLNRIMKIDNIDLGPGAGIYLAGVTLMADGRTWISSQLSAGGVAYEGGTIFGTLMAPAPEPTTLALIGTGVLGAIGWARRRRMN